MGSLFSGSHDVPSLTGLQNPFPSLLPPSGSQALKTGSRPYDRCTNGTIFPIKGQWAEESRHEYYGLYVKFEPGCGPPNTSNHSGLERKEPAPLPEPEQLYRVDDLTSWREGGTRHGIANLEADLQVRARLDPRMCVQCPISLPLFFRSSLLYTLCPSFPSSYLSFS